jgi:malonate-semialdehyde dehydrogenase (acetylating)/methylmalonate-semialdehyde dehydrogenase
MQEVHVRTIEHWIDGSFTHDAGAATSPVFNPATGQKQAQVVLGSAAEVDAAVQCATRAFEEWGQSSLSRRTKVLFAFRELVNARAQELAELITDEHGKVLTDALGEVQRGLEVVEYACGIPQALKGEFSDQVSADVDSYSYREPLGVVAGITPFNFPAMVPMWMFPIAIATGNTFILKPSERDPSASLLLARLWQEAGLPDGVFNVVQGDASTVNAILDHPGISAVSFVGSTNIARHIHARATAAGKRVQALGGAKNHAVVLPDADLEFASTHLIAAAFGSAGERCMAISVAVAVGTAADGLVNILETQARAINVGSGRDAGVDMGPVVTEQAKLRIVELIASAQEQGADIRVDGRGIQVDGYESGFFVGPTLIDGVEAGMDVYQQEVFGPVLALVRVNTLEEAIAFINANPFGNGTAVFTNSGAAARAFIRGVQVGMVGVNVPVPVPMAYHSFGGWKDSLIGEHHMHGPEGVHFYTRGKVVTARWPQDALGASFDMPTAR